MIIDTDKVLSLVSDVVDHFDGMHVLTDEEQSLYDRAIELEEQMKGTHGAKETHTGQAD